MSTTNGNGNRTNGNGRRGSLNSVTSSQHDRRPPPLRLPSSTFEAQASLPRLPIPTLEETLDKFPKLIHALQTPAEREAELSLLGIASDSCKVLVCLAAAV